jgi:hypothetical protein
MGCGQPRLLEAQVAASWVFKTKIDIKILLYFLISTFYFSLAVGSLAKAFGAAALG